MQVTPWLVSAYAGLVLVLLATSRSRPLLFLRLAFLSAPGLMCSLALSGDYVLSPHMMGMQIAPVFTKAIWLSALALVGARFGWWIGERVAKSRPVEWVTVVADLRVRRAATVLFIVLAVWFAEGKGETIFVSRYGMQAAAKLPLGNVNAIINIAIATMMYFVVARVQRGGPVRRRQLVVILVLVFALKVVYANLLRGIRADALDTILTVYILLGFYAREFARVRRMHLLVAAALVAALYVVGLVRSGLAVAAFGGIREYSMIVAVGAGRLLHVSTLSNITATFTGLISFADGGYAVEWSRTYLGYPLRIPPEFLYPNRPDDLALIFGESGFTSGGGTFELGEAYLALGVPGVVVVPALISILFSFLVTRVRMLPGSIVPFILLASLVAVFSRGAWYQTFAYFKSFVTGVIWLAALFLVAERRRFGRDASSGMRLPLSRGETFSSQASERHHSSETKES